MRPVKCENSHHFDADKYSVCPICGKGQSTNQTVSQSLQFTSKSSGNKAKDFISNLISKKKQVDEKVIDVNGHNNTETVGMFSSDRATSSSKGTVSEVLDSNAPSAQSPLDVKSQPLSDQYSQIDTFSTPSQGGLLMEEKVDQVDIPEPSNDNGGLSSLKQQLEQVTNDNQGKTVGFFGGKVNEETEDDIIDPVVGWIVAIKGPHKGQSYEITSGKNSVGRSNNNNIVVSKDNMVSRENHAWLIYEPKKRDFFVQGGDGRGLVYVNDENVMTTQKISSGDSIEIGESVFMLVPLCGENFSWDELDT